MRKPYKYKLTIQYDGTTYSGWQIQPGAPTIQDKIQKTLEIFLGEPIWITGSGRTDAGVHALGQIAHFEVSKEINLHRFMAAANGLLPPEIRVLDIASVTEDFHARYSAKGKIYHYHIWTQHVHSPFRRPHTTYFPQEMNSDLLREAAQLFVGTHDFTSFANSPSEGSVAKNPVRTVHRVDIVDEEGGFRIEIEANGFLYKMVRNIVGMLLDVATGKRPIEDISRAFELKDRKFSSRAAPPNGLFLVKVHY